MDTRKKILDTASRLFYKQGYNSTGINQVIKEAGVAKASLYQYFPSKEDMLYDYLTTTALATNQTLKQVADKYTDAKEKVLALFDFLVDFSEATEYNGCNFLNVNAELPQDNGRVSAFIKNQKDQVIALFRDILKTIGKQDLAPDIYVLFDGAMIATKVYKSNWPIDAAKRTVIKLI
jgi:AcrR family transcriptional regulator